MDSFLFYDVGFLILFSIFVAWFLHKQSKLPKEKNPLSREGWIYMYRTKAGIKAINYVGDNFQKLLRALVWPIIFVGLILMAGILWMLTKTLSIYILFPEITNFVKAPPIAPLIPYFPKLFGMESLFPPFYFTYFIIALGVVAIVHEFSHGIFMRLFKVKIKSTGLVFLGPILGAFVEEEKKGFVKKKNKEQMAILGAGVFANLLFALIFYGLYVLFFFSSFEPTGFSFNTYGVSLVPVNSIKGFEEYGNWTRINATNGTFYLDESLSKQLEGLNQEYLIAYPESPAVLLQMEGAITQIDDVKILNQEDLRKFMESKNPGDRVLVKTITEEGERAEYSAELSKHPENSSRAYLGVGYAGRDKTGAIQKTLSWFMSFKDESTYYSTTWDGDFVYFIYHLLWWVMIINLLVALFNMLPLGILDGGRFFYLAILSVTRSEKTAVLAYKLMKWFILAIFVLMMWFWFIRII